MGATNFITEVYEHREMQDAYNWAVEEAIGQFGRDAYNGTITTTSGCRREMATPMTLRGAELYAGESVWTRCEKWGSAHGIPISDDSNFTFKTVTLTVEVPVGTAAVPKWDVIAAGRELAVKKYGSQVHGVEVEVKLKNKVVVTNTPGRSVLRYAITRGRGYSLFETKAQAVAAAKELLEKSDFTDPVQIRAMKVFPDEPATTVTSTVELKTLAATGKVTVTLAVPKTPAPPVKGWIFFGIAAM